MKARILKGSLKLFIAIFLLWIAMNIPSYFLGVDSSVLRVFKDSQDKLDLSKLYLATAKPSLAKLLSTNLSDIEKLPLAEGIETMQEANPLWRFSGGKNAFFEENITLVSPAEYKEQSAFEYLASSANRNRLLELLSASRLPMVGDILKLRNLNTTLFPPAFSSAGAPYSASIIITAILVQNSDFNSNLLKDISARMPLFVSDTKEQRAFEEYCMGLLYFAKNMSFVEMGELVAKANSLKEISELAMVFAQSESKSVPFENLASAFLLYPNAQDTISYLEGKKEGRLSSYIEASNYSQAALEKLLSDNLNIHKSPAYMENVLLPLEGTFASLSAYYTNFALFLKLLLIFLASYSILSINIWRSDTPSWYSPLALVRGTLGAIVLGSLIWIALEPSVFSFNLEEEKPLEFKLAIQNLNNLIGENDIMKFNLDTPTILTLSLFLLMQFVIFASCLIKIASIKRMPISPAVKMELLSNEDNLFDLGLYVGLGGTVLSLIMLSLSMMNTALMAGYSSTLFGIMFTALLKIAFVRPYRHRLVLEVARCR